MLGELLITAGVILGLFVVWQLWWTDVLAARTQHADIAAVRAEFASSTSPEASPRASTDPPPITGAVGTGEDLGILSVPRWGEDYEVLITEGVDTGEVLNTGSAGHYPDTALPGEVGNFALAGHRQSYGAAFRHVDQLQEDDALLVEVAEGWLVYRVSESYVVEPDRVDVIAAVPGSPGATAKERTLTVTTCHPLFSIAERWITHAQYAEWYPREQGLPDELLEVA